MLGGHYPGDLALGRHGREAGEPEPAIRSVPKPPAALLTGSGRYVTAALAGAVVGMIVGALRAVRGEPLVVALEGGLLAGFLAGPCALASYFGLLEVIGRLAHHYARLRRASALRAAAHQPPSHVPPEVWDCRLGTIELLGPDLPTGVARLQELRDTRGTSLPALNNLGVGLALQSRFAEARVAFAEAQEEAPGDPDVELNIARLRLRTHHAGSALRHLGAALTAAPLDTVWRHVQACLRWIEGDHADALANFDGLVAEAPRPSPQLLNNWAVALATAGQLDDASAALSCAIARGGGATSLNNRGLVAYLQGHWRPALRDLRRARRRGEDPLIDVNLGIVLHTSGRIEQAQERFRAVIHRTPVAFEACFNLAESLLDSRQPEDALVAVDQALTHQPDDLDARLLRGCILYWLGRFGEAEEQFHATASGRYARRALVRHNLGLVYARTGRYDQAISMLRAACDLEPELLAHHRALAYAYHLAERLEEAYETHKHVLRMAHTGVALYHLGLCEYAFGRMQHAAQQFEEALWVEPTLYAVYFPLGCTYHALDRPADALRYWERGLEYEPESAELLTNVGLAYYRIDNAQKAVEYLRRAYLAQPDNPAFVNNLALAYAKAERFDRAADFFEKAVELERSSAIMRCNLGLAYYLCGRVEEALEQWMRASEVDPHYYLRRRADLRNTFDDIDMAIIDLDWRHRAIPPPPLTAGFRHRFLLDLPQPPWRMMVTEEMLVGEEEPAQWSDEAITVVRRPAS